MVQNIIFKRQAPWNALSRVEGGSVYLEGLDVHVRNGRRVHHRFPPFRLLVRDDDAHPLRGKTHIFPMLRITPSVDAVLKVQRIRNVRSFLGFLEHGEVSVKYIQHFGQD